MQSRSHKAGNMCDINHQHSVTGKALEKLLDEAHITANKNTIPNDPRSPFVTSGVRLGKPAATRPGIAPCHSKEPHSHKT